MGYFSFGPWSPPLSSLPPISISASVTFSLPYYYLGVTTLHYSFYYSAP